ncbi:MAG: Glycerophosphodiester phosphodiesterase, cytoplasmic [Candidatus Celerinatantimonas neptuna]|nr:MAG: Glycerophosphodiester phosphodiesterase, cytoplasmic [Candidatus Celerinatantimonas neptuna]
MKYAGHRGLASLAPENTLSGVRMAAENGINWIEMDVQLSRDHYPVIIHDESVARCSNGLANVRNLTWNELQQLDFGRWFNTKFTDEKIPSLKQLLSECQSCNLSLNLELKLYPLDDTALLVEKVATQIDACQFPLERIIISSFTHQALLDCRIRLPQIRLGHLWNKIPENWQQQLNEFDAFSVHCNYLYLNKEMAHAIKDAGYELYTYTPNDPAQISQHEQWGVDMMISDCAQKLRAQSIK